MSSVSSVSSSAVQVDAEKKQPVRLCCVDTTVTVSTVLIRRWSDGKTRCSLPAADPGAMARVIQKVLLRETTAER